jgi:hypothetical protein
LLFAWAVCWCNLPISASCVSGIIGMHHHAWLFMG